MKGHEPQHDGPIKLDDQFLGHLHEAAYDWGIESLDEEPVVARRAAIWFGRCIVTLIDEIRRLRAPFAKVCPLCHRMMGPHERERGVCDDCVVGE